MNLQQTVSKILGREVSIEEAMQFANEQYGTLCQFNKEKRTRVYLINLNNVDLNDHYQALTDEQFMDIAEQEGTVYPLKGFADAFNLSTINTESDVIRII